jgi:hypothetical protein
VQCGTDLPGQLIGHGADHHLQRLGRRPHHAARAELPQARLVDGGLVGDL